LVQKIKITMLALFRTFTFAALLVSPVALFGQPTADYTVVPLTDLSAFEAPMGSWKVTSQVTMNPTNTNPLVISVQSGSGTLVGAAGSTLSTKARMQDMRLRLDFMLSPGARAYITLPGGQRVLLSEGGVINETNASTSGFIGQVPVQNAARTAGLWQTMELAYDASTETQPTMARLNSLVLNKVVVQQSVYLPLKSAITAAEPLTLEVVAGTVAFRNIGYQLLANRKTLAVADITYKLYKDAWDTPNPSKLEREGPTRYITQELGSGMREFHVVFDGEMIVGEAGNYTFSLAQSGPRARLSIDGKDVLTVGESTSQDRHTSQANLSAGKHRFQLNYSRFPWRRPALGLSVYSAGVRPYDLTALSSLPVPEPKPYIGVVPEGKPEMVRSFVQYDNEKVKRTHVLSVGSPNGWHYTMDLNRGALLQGWRGQFADVTEMWYERGEPQLLSTAGLTTLVSGQSSYAMLSAPSAAWPDSSDLNYLGYRLNADGTPSIRYAIAGTTLTDFIAAEEQGLNRTLTLAEKAASPVYVLLGAGDEIIQVEKGLYRVDNRYYVRVDKKAKVTTRTSAGKQELMMAVDGTVSYSLFW
jgi:hypothetical protein